MPTHLTKNEERFAVAFENEGQKLFGVVHLPLVEPPYPAVLMCHGLSGNRIGRARQYVYLSQHLARLGIASLRFDYRGSGDSEGDLSEMTLESEISDTLCAMRYLTSLPGIDPERMGLFGRSLGGLVGLSTAARSHAFKSLAIWSAVYDGHQWRHQHNAAKNNEISAEQRHQLATFNGQTTSDQFHHELFNVDMTQILQELSNIPLLDIHGSDDSVVSIEHARRYQASRKASMDISKFIMIPTAEHEFVTPALMQLAIDETCKWFITTI